MRLRVQSACLACLVLLLAFPLPADAVRVVAALGLDATPILSASGDYVVVSTTQRITPDDGDWIEDVYVFSLTDATWRRLPRVGLLGTADADAHAIVLIGVSDDGRFIAYVSQRLSTVPFTPPGPRLLTRYDVLTGARVVIRDSGRDPFQLSTMSRDGTTMAWIGAANQVMVARVGAPAVDVGEACPALATLCPVQPLLTAHADRVLYMRYDGGPTPANLEVVTLATGHRVRYDEVRAYDLIACTGDGRHVLIFGPWDRHFVFDTVARRAEPVSAGEVQRGPVLSDDGRYLINRRRLFDRWGGLSLLEDYPGWEAVSADGRLVAGWTSVVSTNRLFILVALDADGDGMNDPWESVHGLDPASPLDAHLDPDGDGQSNAREFAVGSHPNGTYRAVLAEGAANAFFDSAIHVVTNSNRPVTATFMSTDGSAAASGLAARSPFAASPYWGSTGHILPPAMLPSGPFSVVIESDAPFAAERLMTWAAGSQRGAHGARAVQPSMTWYFAEGATFGPFESFYLLANPGDADATTVVRYLCRGLGAVTRTYTVPARGRTTIWVDQQGAPLDNAECGAHIEASVPIVAERSVYLNGPDGFTGGTATTGAPKLSTTWRFPAGETGDPYETFLLLANPSADAAFVDVHFQLTGGGVERRTYTVPARERLTAWVDQEGPVLAAASFSMVVEASVPIVAERAMWWRGDGASWVEGHVEVGAAAAATQWWLAHVPESATIVMLNETTRPGRVRMSPITQDGQIASIGDIELPPGRTAVSLTAIWPQLGPGVYGVTLESLPVDELGAVPFVAERTHRVPLRDAGTAIMGTPMP